MFYRKSQKKRNLAYSIRMCWTNFWPPTVHEQQNIFENTLIWVGSSHLYASFGTFCIQIGQFLEAQWVFEKCLKTVKSLFLKENEVDFETLWKFKSSNNCQLTYLNAKGAKRSLKMWAINFYKRFFRKYFVVHLR